MTLTRFAPAALVLLAALPVQAQMVPPTSPQTVPQPQTTEEPGMLDRLLGGLLNRMFEDAAPHLDNIERDLGALAQSMRPTLENLGALIDDIGNYESPERLANGDVIIRRKPGAPPPPPLPEMPERGLTPFPDAPGTPSDSANPLAPLPPGGEIEL